MREPLVKRIAIILCMLTAVGVAPTAAVAIGLPAEAAGGELAAASATSTQPATAEAKGAPSHAGGFLNTMARAFSKLYLCFELVGVASVVAWIIVWITLIVWSFRTPGMPVYLAGCLLVALVVVYALMVPRAGEILAVLVWPAMLGALAIMAAWAFKQRELPFAFAILLLATGAFGLGRRNSDNVSRIMEDRSVEIAAARQRQIEARRTEASKLRSRASSIRFVEDDANDAMDAAGYSKEELARLQADDANIAALAEPAYRNRGKQKRDPNQIDANAPILESTDEMAELEAAARIRRLPGADYVLANQLDLLNRFAIWLTLVTAMLVAAVEYLRRFNRTFGSILPLPIACRAIDAIWPKTHAVMLIPAGPTDKTVRDYLDGVVSKGESFILISADDPWPRRDRLPRLPLLRGLWPLRKVVKRPDDLTCTGGFVFESAWYGRYGFVLPAESLDEPLRAMLGGMLEMLRMRHHTRASARRTVNVVWDLPEAMPSETVEELVFLCREANFKFVAIARDKADWASDLFDEVHNVEAGSTGLPAGS